MIRETPESLAAKFDAAATEARQELLAAGVQGDQVAVARHAGASAALSLAAEAVRHNLTETPDERRERFEAWIRSRFPTSADVLLKMRDGTCWNYSTNAEWQGFTAAMTWTAKGEQVAP